MKSPSAIALIFFLCSAQLWAQPDIIERHYFPNARAKNAAVAAARYAEEAYYYTKFTTYISAVDSSRMFADTALFFVKRALMLADTSLRHAPKINFPAIDFLKSGVNKTLIGDSIIREFYPMVDVKSHNVFGTDASLHLSNAVMEYFNASLLLHGEKDAPHAEVTRYNVMPYNDEIIRLEADETAFQNASNQFEKEIAELTTISVSLEAKISAAPDQKTRFVIRSKLDNIERHLSSNVSQLQSTSKQIKEIRSLLNQKHLSDVQDVEEPEHLSKFETTGKTDEVVMNESVPDGLVYKIQLGYYSNNVDVDNFHGLFPITGETVSPNLARYYAGLFFSYEDASKGAEYVQNNAIANAFIVPFYNGNKISSSWAVEIERNRGVK